MGILNEYEEVLIGNRKQISKGYFIFDKKGNERVALAVIRYAIENLLGWNIEEAASFFNTNYIELMKLGQMVRYIDFPSDVTQEDTEYILYLLYPKHIEYELQRYTLRIYDEVMAGKRRYPKDYMYGYLGLVRAKICLQHVIQKTKLFLSQDAIYSFFASPECLRYLKDNKLYQLYCSFYATPLEYLHDSMPSSVKNEFLFHNYMFELKLRQIQETSSIEKKKKDPQRDPDEETQRDTLGSAQ